MPDQFPADGHTMAGFLLDSVGTAIADIEAPETDELSTMLDWSCEIPSGGVAMNISTNAIDASSLCSNFVLQTSGRTGFAPVITFWRNRPPLDVVWDVLGKGVRGWFFIRTGYEYDTPLADGQALDVLAYLESQDKQPEYPGGDTNTTFNVPFLLTGGKFTMDAVIGGAS